MFPCLVLTLNVLIATDEGIRESKENVALVDVYKGLHQGHHQDRLRHLGTRKYRTWGLNSIGISALGQTFDCDILDEILVDTKPESG